MYLVEPKVAIHQYFMSIWNLHIVKLQKNESESGILHVALNVELRCFKI